MWERRAEHLHRVWPDIDPGRSLYLAGGVSTWRAHQAWSVVDEHAPVQQHLVVGFDIQA